VLDRRVVLEDVEEFLHGCNLNPVPGPR
jgi:hypothetical protein